MSWMTAEPGQLSRVGTTSPIRPFDRVGELELHRGELHLSQQVGHAGRTVECVLLDLDDQTTHFAIPNWTRRVSDDLSEAH